MAQKRKRSLDEIAEIELSCTHLGRDLDDLTNRYLREKHGPHEKYSNRPASYSFDASDCDPGSPDSIIQKIGELLLEYAGPKTRELSEDEPLNILALALRNIGIKVETLIEDLLHKKDYAGTPLQSTSYRRLSMIGYEAVHVLEEYLEDNPEILEQRRQAKQQRQEPPSPLIHRPKEMTLQPEEIEGPKQRRQFDPSVLEPTEKHGQLVLPDRQAAKNLDAQGIQPASLQTGQEVTTEGGLILPYGRPQIDDDQEAPAPIEGPKQRPVIQLATEPQESGDRRSFAGVRIESEVDDKGKKALVIDGDLSGPENEDTMIELPSRAPEIQGPTPKTPRILTPTGEPSVVETTLQVAQPESVTQTQETTYHYEAPEEEQAGGYEYISAPSEQEESTFYIDSGSNTIEPSTQREAPRIEEPATVAAPKAPAVDIPTPDLDARVDMPSAPTPELDVPEVPVIQLVETPQTPGPGLFGPDDAPLDKITDLPDIPDISGPNDWEK